MFRLSGKHIISSAGFALVLTTWPALGAPGSGSCYKDYYELMARVMRNEPDLVVTPAGSDAPIARAFEKEGLMYSDIALWFDRVVEDKSRERVFGRLKREKSKEVAPILSKWLKEFPQKNRAAGSGITKPQWESLTPEQQLELLFTSGKGNFIENVNIKGRERLFLDGILNFDDLKPGAGAPPWLAVGDDLGSYEVRSAGGEADLAKFAQQRKVVEDELESRIGHQHIVHSWPKDAAKRAEQSAEYIELLDSGTWYLFWRQMKRDPNDVAGIIDHPYLGVYNKRALDRLHRSYVDGDPSKFKNKFRMIGARNVDAKPEMGQGTGKLPDFELRSGNKGLKRDFVENLMISRLTSGDYSGLRKYNAYDFDASISLEDLNTKYVTMADDADDAEEGVLFTKKGLESLKEFEERFPYMAYSAEPTALNHFRNKVIAPLLPWENRLDLRFKQEILETARAQYADDLVKISRWYNKADRELRVRGRRPAPDDVSEIRTEALERIEAARYEFAKRVRLDRDFQRYLVPQAKEMPSIVVKNSGPLDVNHIDLGIEFSFRFPNKIYSKTGADEKIGAMAANLKRWMGGGTLEKLDEGGHGHGLSLRYRLTDPKGRTWRIEWDGISRSYEDGKPVRPRGGHIEIPSPKFAPQTADDVRTLYGAAAELGLDPSRHAGGAHVNVDLAPLFALDPKVGARKMANLLAYFESNREVIAFLWEHPYRRRAALPLDLSPSFIDKLNAFDGDWDALAKLLYNERYFNDFVTRKPGYSQLNATAVMSSVVPKEYQNTIDIKNPTQVWFPAFGGKGRDRVEFRLFDAQYSDYAAALQIKYVRALLNRSLNAEGAVPLKFVHRPGTREEWVKDPKAFWEAMVLHLNEIGLDPKEYEPLYVEAMQIQQLVPMAKPPLERYKDFLPPVTSP